MAITSFPARGVPSRASISMTENNAFTVEELRKLGRGLHIPIEEMRAALRY